MRIIIIDDNKNDIWKIYEDLLDVENVEYHAFKEHALSAVNYIKHHDVTGAFIDIHMPTIMGDQLAELLLKENPKLKIVFYTGYAVDEERLRNQFKKNLLGFCYKPLNINQFKSFLNQMLYPLENSIQFCMYGIFDCFVNGKRINFYCAKSKELLALLVVYRGRSVSKNIVIQHLWLGETLKNVDALYRDARWKLRDILNQYNIGYILSSGKGDLALIINENMKCDYWNNLDNDTHNTVILEDKMEEEHKNNTFLVEYDWGIEY